MSTQQAEQFRLLGGKLGHLVANHQSLLLCVESKLSDLVHRDLLALLALYAAQYGLDSEQEFLHRERLGDIIVSTDLEALEDIFLYRFRGKEYDGHLRVDRADFLRECESVLFGHHHIKHTQVVLAFQESLVAAFAIGKQIGIIALGLEVFAKKHTEILVVLAKQYTQSFFHNNLFLYVCIHLFASGRVIMNRVPCPSSLSTVICPPSSLTILLT